MDLVWHASSARAVGPPGSNRLCVCVCVLLHVLCECVTVLCDEPMPEGLVVSSHGLSASCVPCRMRTCPLSATILHGVHCGDVAALLEKDTWLPSGLASSCFKSALGPNMPAPSKPSISASSRGSGAHRTLAASPCTCQKPCVGSETASRAATIHSAEAAVAHLLRPEGFGGSLSLENITESRSLSAGAEQRISASAPAGSGEVLLSRVTDPQMS